MHSLHRCKPLLQLELGTCARTRAPKQPLFLVLVLGAALLGASPQMPPAPETSQCELRSRRWHLEATQPCEALDITTPDLAGSQPLIFPRAHDYRTGHSSIQSRLLQPSLPATPHAVRADSAMSEERSKVSLRSGNKRKGRPAIKISGPIIQENAAPRGSSERSRPEAVAPPRQRPPPQSSGKVSRP